MRHVPYRTAVNGGEALASTAMAITADDGWLGGSSGQQRSGGGKVSGASTAAGARAASSELPRLPSEVRNGLQDQRNCGQDLRNSGQDQRNSSHDHSSDQAPKRLDAELDHDDPKTYGRASDKPSLFWSTVTAGITIVPKRESVVAADKRSGRPTRRSLFKKRPRRPNLSNVVEAVHENGASVQGGSVVGDSSNGVGSGGQSEERIRVSAPRVNGSGGSSSAVTQSPRFGFNDKGENCWHRDRIFSSVPEDDDEDWSLDADQAERTGLLRSASLPDNEAKPTITGISKAAKATSMTSVNDAESEDKHASYSSSGSNSSANVAASSKKLGKWSKSKIDLLVPSIKSLVTITTNKLASSTTKASTLNCRRRSGCCGSTSNLFGVPATSSTSFSRFDIGSYDSPKGGQALRRNISLSCMTASGNGYRYEPMNARSSDNLAGAGALAKKLRKCNTMVTLSGGCTVNGSPAGCGSTVHIEPLQPVNRLRVGASSQDFQAASKMYSRCSSLLSMASSSRYSLNSAYGFVPITGVLCKVCLNEVPLNDSWTLQHCECSYCVDCVRSYVEFEINQGAYSISCPDAQCEKQGIILLEEIESLVSLENHEKHKRYRLNKEVEMDKSRTWCPRAGCETVCTLGSTDRCTPQNVHCPTCQMDFCSNCRAAWHADSPCKSEEVVPGVTFDSELIKCCPMCSVPIEKDEGCAQMLCKRCKHVFCWYCLASLDDDFLLRHYDKGPCKNKLGHSRASVIWHRTQVISIFAGFGILLLIASPLLLLAAPCIVCCKCRVCSSDTKLDVDDDIPEAAELQTTPDPSSERGADEAVGAIAETHS